MPPRAATMNQLEDDDDDHSDHADSVDGAGGGGKDKNATTARKAQNRVAQREFRQRKQQYIRDLEAKVEVLSGDKEERVELMVLLVKNLLKENKELRGMIKGMAGFVGEGLGSCLPRLGLSAPQLDAILSRADTDTAYEAFVKLRASRELEEANPGIPFGDVVRRKSTTSKRKRDSTMEAGPSASSGSAPNAPTRSTSDNAEPVSLTDTPESKFARLATGAERSATAGDNNDQADADTYNYLFPDTSSTEWSRFASGQPMQQGRGDMAFPGSPLGAVREAYPHQYPAFSQEQQQAAIRGMFPLGGPAYSGQAPMWGPFGAMTGDLSGFGLTLPPGGMGAQGDSQTMSSLAGPSGAGGDPNYAASHASVPFSSSRQTQRSDQSQVQVPGRASAMPDISARDQQKLKMAVTMMVQSKGVTDGPLMSADEIQERMRVQRDLVESFQEDDGLRKRIEPMQLIAYHINNYRVNHAYVLPTSMRPTAVQRTIPHEHAIDGVPFPSVRDRMILLRGRYDLIEAYQGMLLEMVLRGDDPMDHRNWEFSEKWLHDFPILADEEVYVITNRWRVERGVPPLVRPEQRT